MKVQRYAISTQAESFLAAPLQKLAEAERDVSTQIPGFDVSAMRQEIIGGMMSGSVDTAKLLGSMLGAAASVGCAAVGAGAFSGLCAKAGAMVGEALASFQARPVGAQETTAAKALSAMLAGITEQVKNRRKGIYYAMSAKLAGDAAALAQVEKVLNLFFPENRQGGFYLPLWAWGCQWIGALYSDACPALQEYPTDYSLDPAPKSGWAQACLGKLVKVCKADYGVNISRQAIELIQQNEEQTRWWRDGDQAAALFAFITDLQEMLWPVLDAEMGRRMGNVLATAAAKSQVKYVKALDGVVAALAEKNPDAPRKQIVAQAATLAKRAADEGLDSVLKSTQPESKPKSSGGGAILVGAALVGGFLLLRRLPCWL